MYQEIHNKHKRYQDNPAQDQGPVLEHPVRDRKRRATVRGPGQGPEGAGHDLDTGWRRPAGPALGWWCCRWRCRFAVALPKLLIS